MDDFPTKTCIYILDFPVRYVSHNPMVNIGRSTNKSTRNIRAISKQSEARSTNLRIPMHASSGWTRIRGSRNVMGADVNHPEENQK